MEENPFSPPQSDLETSVPLEPGVRLPWEDPVQYPRLWDRIRETAKQLLSPSQAGEALGGHRSILPALTYLALVGLPLPWISQVLLALFGTAAKNQEILQLIGLPSSPPPDPSAQAVQRVIQVAGAVMVPLSLAIGLAVWGLLVHGGLWATGALRSGKGLETTFRTLLYSSALMFLVSWIFNLWVFLPPVAALAVFACSFLAWISFGVYQGILLARAHGTQTWRGVLGIFAPWLLFLFCCGGLGLLFGLLFTAGMNR